MKYVHSNIRDKYRPHILRMVQIRTKGLYLNQDEELELV
jgi:hypothetical protein